MARKIRIFLLILCLKNNYKAQQNWSWLIGSDLCQAVTVGDIELDQNQNTYVAAAMFGSFSIGTSTLVSQGLTDGVLQKYSQNGTLIWSLPIQGTDFEFFSDLVCDAQGDLYCAGYATSSITSIGTQTIAGDLTANNFICKISAAGQLLWFKRMVGSGASAPKIQLSNTSVYSGFAFTGSLSANNGTITSAGFSDILVSSYDLSGNLQWCRACGGTQGEYFADLTLLGTNEVVVVGSTSSSVITCASNTIAGITSTNYSPIVLLKYDGTGNLIWAKCLQNVNGGSRVEAATNSDFFLAGTLNASAGSIGSYSFSANSNLSYVSKFDGSGNVLWAKGITASGGTGAIELVSDNFGNAILFGEFDGTSVNVDAFTAPNDSTNRQLYLCYMNGNGQASSLQSIGGKYRNYAHCIDLAASGDLVISGYTSGIKMSLGNQLISHTASGSFMYLGKTASIFTGVNNISEITTNSKLFPNPSSDFVTLIQEGSIEDIKVLDDMGREISMEYVRLENGLRLNFENYSNGIYLIDIKGQNGHNVYRFVKD